MTRPDAGARPDAATGPIEVFDIPLVGDASTPSSEPASPEPAEPNWRRAVAIALVGGTIVGVVGATILLRSDDDPVGADGSTLPADELAAQITTPPTLRPLDTLPLPDDPALARTALDEAPQPTTSQDWDLFSGVTLPSYPPVTDVGLADLVTFDIAGAVARLADDRPRRSETHLELGTAGFVVDVTIERDPAQDRYRVVLENRGDRREAVVDVAGDRTLFTTPDGDVVEQSNAELLGDAGTATVNEFFDPLLLGPLRPESYDPVATRGRSLVTIGTERVVREFVTVIQGSLIPEWQLYAFSPVFEFPVEDRPSVLEYAAYVSEDGDIVQVDGLSLVGDVPQLVTHRLVDLDADFRIELPEATPSTSTPMTPPPPGG